MAKRRAEPVNLLNSFVATYLRLCDGVARKNHATSLVYLLHVRAEPSQLGITSLPSDAFASGKTGKRSLQRSGKRSPQGKSENTKGASNLGQILPDQPEELVVFNLPNQPVGLEVQASAQGK